jgi:dTMP kinase
MTGPGRLIVLEGIDGAGKSTLQRALAARLRAEGHSVRLTREPSDPELGRRAQAVGSADPMVGALLFTLDRWQARAGIESQLRGGRIVLQDRSFFSTIAYQGSALSARERRTIVDLQRFAAVTPDRVLLLDLSPERALARLRGRGKALAPFERRRVLARVRRAYLRLARVGRWAVLDADEPATELAEAALRAIRPLLPPRPRRRAQRRSFTPGRETR